ncbi:MAG TPA: PD-(D/E)XK nuclease family protein [Methanocorpusculum sp.]|nr:PD-(D/E)XK nuclease family protein [Methanocorpusculum sp.]
MIAPKLPHAEIPLAEPLRLFTEGITKDPFTTWLIVENRTAKEYAASLLNTPLLAEHITTLKELAVTLIRLEKPDTVRLNNTDALLLFTKAVALHIQELTKNTNPLPLEFISNLLGLYNFSIENELTLAPGETETQKTQKHRALARIFAEYETLCRKLNALDPVNCMKEALCILQDKTAYPTLPLTRVITVNTAPQNTLSIKFLDAVKERTGSGCTSFNDAAPSETDTKPAAEFERPTTLGEDAVRAYATDETELRSILDECCTLLEKGAKPQDLLILTPDITRTVNLLESLIREFYYKDEEGRLRPLQYITDSKDEGKPAAAFPLIQSAVSAYQAAGTGFRLTDLEQISASPHFTTRPKNIPTPGMLAKISLATGVVSGRTNWTDARKRLKAKNLDETYCADGLISLIEWLEKAQGGKTFSTRAQTFLDFLEKSGWTEAEVSSAEEQNARKNLTGYLNRLIVSPAGFIDCTPFEFNTHLTRFLKGKRISYEKDPAECIRIAKIRVSAGLKADYVFISGLTADSIPSITLARPPFTRAETEDLIPGLEEKRLGPEIQNFAGALLCAKKQLVLSYAKVRGTKNTTPSSFMTALGEPKSVSPVVTHSVRINAKTAGKALASDESAENLAGLGDKTSIVERMNHERKREYEETRGADFADTKAQSCFAAAYDEKYAFSPTNFETYLGCPFQWYLKKHLRLTPPSDISSETLNGGNALHKALELFFSRHFDLIEEGKRSEALEKLKELCEKTFSEQINNSPSWEAKRCWYTGERGLPSIFNDFIDDEIDDAGAGWETDETMVEQEIKTTLEHNGEKMNLYGFADRIKTNGMMIKIVDYKTGSSQTLSEKVAKGKLVQIPLYTKALCDITGKMPDKGYYQIMKTKECSRISVFIKKEGRKTIELNPDDVIESVLDLCFALRREMQNGNCRISDPECKDSYCPFARICRVNVERSDF